MRFLWAFASAFHCLPTHKQNCLYASKEGFCHLKVCFPSTLCYFFYSHAQQVQSRSRAPSCWVLCRLKSRTLLKPMLKVSPSSGFYSRSCLGQADKETFLSPGALVFAILHGLAAVLASKRLQKHGLFWGFIKRGRKPNQNREEEKQHAQVSHVATLLHILFLERAGPLLVHGESPWYDKRSTHVASAWLRLSSRCQKEPRAICRYIMQPSSRELAEFWNLYLVLTFCTELASEIPAPNEWQLELWSRNICPPKLLNSPTAKSVTDLADRQGQQCALGTVSRSFVPLVPILCRTVCLIARWGKATLVNFRQLYVPSCSSL